MVKIHPITDGPMAMIHVLKSNIVFNGFEEGEAKKCYIQKMSNGRFGVMSYSYKDNFYKVLQSEQELHDSFEEILTD